MFISLLTASLISNFGVAVAASNRTFPPNFKFGVATASYQIEGGWNEDGKSENVWDHVCHTKTGFVPYDQNGDIACDSYHKWEEDIEMLKELGVDFYRFSLSWTRILPDAIANSTRNQKGIDYYNNLINGLLESGIEPLVTIFHWDTPQMLQDLGGWPDEMIIEHYEYYARVCFEEFGDRVKTWLTFNEPKQTCLLGYGYGLNAPAIISPGADDYKCAHNLLKAHAKAYHIYDQEFRSKQKGRIGITLDTNWYIPGDDSDINKEATQRAIDFHFGWFADPIFRGNYPQSMIDRIETRSRLEGYDKSRLPSFSDDEIDYIKSTADFLGLNHYTTNLVYDLSIIGSIVIPGFYGDLDAAPISNSSWPGSASIWLKVVPWGFSDLVRYISKTYKDVEIIITENGFSDDGSSLHDPERIDYHREYLSSLLDAILDDGAKVTGYTTWSLMDNFEWKNGYTEKFGLYSVNFDDENRTRTPKDSAAYFAKVIKTKCLVDICE